ncbi:MAG: hypothetical protein U9O78_02120 [Patescibacteria group bacterium]|nr:hypothetical protein [Patescibacteria group bacterium]
MTKSFNLFFVQSACKKYFRKRKSLKIASVLISLAVLLLLIASQQIIPTKALAERLESDSYIIQFGNFNMGSGKREGTSYNVSYTLGQTGAGPYGDYQSTNYFVGSGFQYIYQIDSFEFSISDLNIDFSTLTPSNLVTDSNTLTISTRGAGGFTIYAYEQYPLTHTDGSTQIADTTCDGGGCDETEAKPWTSNTIYGFGFNAQGDTVSSDFTSSDPDCSNNTECFRQFADESNSESMQTVMSSTDAAQDETATITYQLAISGTQAAGIYQTGIIYVAVPGY